jgi:pimeloyl-ACP methyl ester carboxylesterase
VEAGPEDGPLIIPLHSILELWFAWRKQMAPLTALGFHVVAPDMRGYGLSEAPQRVAAYHPRDGRSARDPKFSSSAGDGS